MDNAASSDNSAPWSNTLRVADLARKKDTSFDLQPDANLRALIAAELDLSGIKKLRLTGKLIPFGNKDWRLVAEIGATIVQPCVVSLEPVTTRIDETVERNFLTEVPEFDAGSEVEMPEDDSSELLTTEIDLGAIMVEALALAIPPYPRAEGAEIAESRFAEPGKTPLTDEETKPFAALGSLRDKLADKGGKED